LSAARRPGFATRLVSYDASPGDANRPMATPIYQTATFEQEQADSFGAYDYSRSGNPTRRVLEEQMARLENGTRGFCFSSGMTAIATVTHLLRAGDEILADWDLYGGASRLFGTSLERAGVTVGYVDATDIAALTERITPATKMIYVETPTNPLLRVVGIRAVAEVAHEAGLLLCVDNSTLSPYLQNPLDLGADIVLHSGTKFLGGHSDVTGGVVVVKDAALGKKIYAIQNAEGTALGPFDCFLLLRGLKTLKLRMDVQQKNTAAIAEFLGGHAKVRSVLYPGLVGHAGYEIQREQARGAGAVLCFELDTFAQAKQVVERLELFSIAVSFGSVHSTISVPVKMSHASVPAELKSARGIPEGLVRVAVGIEDVEDLIGDLTRELDRL